MCTENSPARDIVIKKDTLYMVGCIYDRYCASPRVGSHKGLVVGSDIAMERNIPWTIVGMQVVNQSPRCAQIPGMPTQTSKLFLLLRYHSS